MPAKILSGKPVAEKIKLKIHAELSGLPEPTVAVVGFHSSPEWREYVFSLEKSAASYGVKVNAVFLPDNASPYAVYKNLDRLSLDEDTHGIILQQPLPREFYEAPDRIAPEKDLDCLNSVNLKRLYANDEFLLPATPEAVIELSAFYDITFEGRNVTILGRGLAVGKPLALTLINRNATVTVCHTRTRNLAETAKRADIIVSACGSAGLVTKEFLNPDSIVIDAGLSFLNGRSCGDAAEECALYAAALSPVPGGLGPVTRACLFQNLVKAYKAKLNLPTV